MPSDDEVENGDVDDDELEQIEEQVEMDYQIGEDLKEKVRRLCYFCSLALTLVKIIPRAIDYFTGKALAYEDEFESDDGVDEFDLWRLN